MKSFCCCYCCNILFSVQSGMVVFFTIILKSQIFFYFSCCELRASIMAELQPQQQIERDTLRRVLLLLLGKREREAPFCALHLMVSENITVMATLTHSFSPVLRAIKPRQKKNGKEPPSFFHPASSFFPCPSGPVYWTHANFPDAHNPERE